MMPNAPLACSPVPAGAGRAWSLLAGLAALALLSIPLACAFGSVQLSPAELAGGFEHLLRGAPADLSTTLLELRLTRVLVAMTTGAALALAGTMMQALLRNPLADPYVLGISGGAAAGALGALLFAAAAWMVDAAAFGGALAVTLLLFALAHRDLRNGMAEGNASLLLLTGVILASGCGALVTLIISLAPDDSLRSMVFWLIGDLSGAQWRWWPALVLAAGLAFCLPAARSINVLTMHAETAVTLGVRTGLLRQGLFVCGAMLTAGAVATAGSIGFVGLIVPHACRFAFGADHRILLPAATLSGGIFLAFADTLARCIAAPQQLPVGVITSLIGVPVFLLQLHSVRRR